MMRKSITFIFILSLALFAGCERNDLYNNATNMFTALLPLNLSSLFSSSQPDIHINVQSTEYLSGSTYDFGTIMAGSSSQGTYFSIDNRGGADLHLTGTPLIQVSGVNAADFSVTTQGTPNPTITSTMNLMFSVNFKPAVGIVGPRTAQIVILSDDPVKGTFVINLQGTASSTPVPDVNVRLGHSSYASGTNYNFGTFMQGTSSQAVAFTLENNGNATLTVSSLQLGGTDGGQFILTGTGPFSIAPGANVTFSAIFSPVTTASFSATITINNSDPDPFESPFVLNLQGTGSATPVPNIDIQSGGVSYPASSSNYNFGAVAVGSSATATFDIVNNGSGNLTLTGSPQTVQASGAEFSVTAVPAAATVIAPGASATFTVTFTPTASSSSQVNGNITVYSDDPDSPRYYISLNGSVALPPEIHVYAMSAENLNGSTYNYGTMEFSAATQSAYFYIQNRGNLDLHLTGTPLIQISGADAGDFSIGLSGTPSTTITSTTGLPFSVMFKPTAATAGTRNARVTILSDDPVNGTFVINLQGTVSATPVPDINVKYGYADYPAGSNYNFGTYEQGSSSQPVTFTIENRGTADLHVASLQLGGADGAQFSLPAAGPFIITSGVPATFTVIFSPGRSGACAATVSIYSDDPDSFENPYILNLNGTGSASPVPNIDIQAGGVSYPSGVTTYPFDSVAVGSSITKTFTIINNGTGNLMLTGTPGTVQIASAEFTVTAMPAASTVIAPGGTATFTIQFSPTASSPSWVYTNATIKSDDPDTPQYNLFMSGSVAQPSISINSGMGNYLNPGSLNCGSRWVGTAGGAGLFSIYNFGSAPLTIYSITLSSLTDFYVSTTGMTNPLPASASTGTTFSLGVNPTTYGPFNAILTIRSNDPVNPTFTINLSGIGMSETILVDGYYLGPPSGDSANTEVFNPNSMSFVDGPLLSNGTGTAGAGSLTLSYYDSLASKNQHVVVQGGSVSSNTNSSIYDLTFNYFIIGPNHSPVGDGASAFHVPAGAGTYGGQFILITGGGSSAVDTYTPGGNFTSAPLLDILSPILSGSHNISLVGGRTLIFHGGGGTPGEMTTIFDPTSSSMIPGPSLIFPETISTGANSFSIGGNQWIVILGGGSTATKIYDAGGNSFNPTPGPSLPLPAGAGSHNFYNPSTGKTIVVLGNNTSNVAEYDPATANFNIATQMLSAPAGDGANTFRINGGTLDGCMMIVHGNNSQGTSLYHPDGTIQSWVSTVHQVGAGGHNFPAR